MLARPVLLILPCICSHAVHHCRSTMSQNFQGIHYTHLARRLQAHPNICPIRIGGSRQHRRCPMFPRRCLTGIPRKSCLIWRRFHLSMSPLDMTNSPILSHFLQSAGICPQHTECNLPFHRSRSLLRNRPNSRPMQTHRIVRMIRKMLL